MDFMYFSKVRQTLRRLWNFDKALEAQRKYMEQLLATKPGSEATQ